MCCKVHAELNSGRVTYLTVESQRGVFLKEKDVILTNDVWRIAVQFDIGPYEEVISTSKEDLLTVEGQKKRVYVYF